MLSSRKRYRWSSAALVGTALTVPAVLVVRHHAEAERARVAAEEQAKEAAEVRALTAERRRLRAELDEVKALTRPNIETMNEHRDGTWLCERYRCNQGDRVPARPRELVPDRTRHALDHFAPQPRRHR
jgi:hypothetical protein